MDEVGEITTHEPTTSTEYFVEVEPAGQNIRAMFNGEVLADSDSALLLRETRLVPVYYFPREDVRMEFLERSDRKTNCPFKGNASYWHIRIGDRFIKNAAWSYETPLDDGKPVENYISFYWNWLDAWYADDRQIFVPDRDRAPRDANPLMDWLLSDAWYATSEKELFELFANALVENGIPLERFRIIIRTLHPQVYAHAYSWTKEGGAETFEAPYSMIASSEFLDSPFAAIIDGAGGVRRRLDLPDPQLDYPILQEILDDGGTDYVAMPMGYSDGQINVISMTSKRPGGFSTDDLGHIYEIMPVLSRLFEAHSLRGTTMTLLDTYLGKQTGRRVLDGQVQRGDGEDINAIIWFCDLRSSTALADSMSRVEFLRLLNQFLEAMAGAVLDAGGEVLRYIGDAALSIFPISGDVGLASPAAAQAAVRAARDAIERMAVVNAERDTAGESAIGYGIGLHRGSVTYGNIGSPERLEFTVIGAAANEAARIEALTKELSVPVLMSSDFNHCYPGKLRSLGEYSLRGVSAPEEIFTFPEN